MLKNVKYITEFINNAFIGSKRLYDNRACIHRRRTYGYGVITTFRVGGHEDCTYPSPKELFLLCFFMFFFYNFLPIHILNTYNNSYRYVIKRPLHRKVVHKIVSAGDKFKYLRLHYIVVKYAFSLFFCYIRIIIYSLLLSNFSSRLPFKFFFIARYSQKLTE